MLRGRDDERAVLARLLEEARAGNSGALVLRGEAGVGKTALLDPAIASASDLMVVRAVGVESEMELAYATLHQLCASLLDRLDRIPAPQREALETTFGLREGPVPDRFLVGLATLGLLSESAQERPLVCGSTTRSGSTEPRRKCWRLWCAGCWRSRSSFWPRRARQSGKFGRPPELVVQGLRDADARALLASAMPGRLDGRVADQLLAEARGNPLALLELPRGLSPAQLAGGFGLPGALSLSGKIEDSFVKRLQALPEDTQQLLLVAAAEPTGDPGLLWRAAARLGIADAVLYPAESARILEVDGRVRFRHPLARSAVYRAATPHQRRRVHRALAEATDAQADPDRRAWHLAEAAAGPDEDVAAELERAAGRAQARGGLAGAAAFLEQAATLTAEPSRRARRALAGAQSKYEAGALDDALALLGTAEAGEVDDAQRARVHLLRAQIAFASKRGGDAPQLLLRAARELEAVDPNLARATYLEAEALGEGLALTIAEFLSETLYLGLGRYDAAVTAVGQAERYPEEGAAIWALVELIEAAVRSGEPHLAGGALQRIIETTRAAGTDWALATEARCRALLSEGDGAETDDRYHQAIEHSGSTSVRTDLARAHLLYGEWLRRKRRRREAREHLRTAFEMFDAMGVEGFAARAERELLAPGERVRARAVETRDELTAQEAQVARLARDGLSNAEIGERLFISQHTVAYHLRRIFNKLGITARGELRRVLPDGSNA